MQNSDQQKGKWNDQMRMWIRIDLYFNYNCSGDDNIMLFDGCWRERQRECQLFASMRETMLIVMASVRVRFTISRKRFLQNRLFISLFVSICLSYSFLFSLILSIWIDKTVCLDVIYLSIYLYIYIYLFFLYYILEYINILLCHLYWRCCYKYYYNYNWNDLNQNWEITVAICCVFCCVGLDWIDWGWCLLCCELMFFWEFTLVKKSWWW